MKTDSHNRFGSILT